MRVHGPLSRDSELLRGRACLKPSAPKRVRREVAQPKEERVTLVGLGLLLYSATSLPPSPQVPCVLRGGRLDSREGQNQTWWLSPLRVLAYRELFSGRQNSLVLGGFASLEILICLFVCLLFLFFKKRLILESTHTRVGGAEGEHLQQTPRRAWSLTRGSIPDPEITT